MGQRYKLSGGFFCLLWLFACGKEAPKTSSSLVWSLRVTASPHGGYGYEIMENGRARIRQAHVPAVEGLRGFPDSLSARAAGALMIGKIQAGQFPPTLSREEVMDILDGHNAAP